MEIVADQVHLFLEFHPSTSLSKAVQYLKGGSSRRLFKLHPELKKRYWGKPMVKWQVLSIRRKCDFWYNQALY